jgi:hypothetical protein
MTTANPLFATSDNVEFDFYQTPRPGMHLPVGTYQLNAHPMRGFYLTRVPHIPFPKRHYGRDFLPQLLETYKQRFACGESTGVWLDGLKGSGKTIFAGRLSAAMRDLQRSTILISNQFAGNAFTEIIRILGDCCFIFDEFEKVYCEESAQQSLLPLFAGAGGHRALLVLTTNEGHRLTDAFKNRPQRLRYKLRFTGLNKDVIDEYVADRLEDKDRVFELVSNLMRVEELNFDIMQAVVEEHNRFGGPIRELLHIMNLQRRPPQTYSTAFVGFNNGHQSLIAGTYVPGTELVPTNEAADQAGVRFYPVAQYVHESDITVLGMRRLMLLVMIARGCWLALNEWQPGEIQSIVDQLNAAGVAIDERAAKAGTDSAPAPTAKPAKGDNGADAPAILTPLMDAYKQRKAMFSELLTAANVHHHDCRVFIPASGYNVTPFNGFDFTHIGRGSTQTNSDAMAVEAADGKAFHYLRDKLGQVAHSERCDDIAAALLTILGTADDFPFEMHPVIDLFLVPGELGIIPHRDDSFILELKNCHTVMIPFKQGVACVALADRRCGLVIAKPLYALSSRDYEF